MADTTEVAFCTLSGHTLVVLEDNEEILNSLTRLLRSWGADILSATHFNASLMKRLANRKRIDLIIADQNLGNSAISGVEAVFRIREIVGFPVPVIMLTAVHGLEVLAEFQRTMQTRMAKNPEMAPAIARSRVEEPIVLQKPTTAAVLNATIAEALGLTAAVAAGHPGPEAVLEGDEDRVS